jgi:hypothetical protein
MSWLQIIALVESLLQTFLQLFTAPAAAPSDKTVAAVLSANARVRKLHSDVSAAIAAAGGPVVKLAVISVAFAALTLGSGCSSLSPTPAPAPPPATSN